MKRRRAERVALALVAIGLAIMAYLYLQGRGQAAPAGRLSGRQVEHLAERHYQLPRGLLNRVATMESSRRDLPPRADGPGCAVSRYQLQVPSCGPVEMTHLSRRATAAWAAAAWLDVSRKWCAARPGRCPCPWARWNYYRRAKVCAALQRGES